MKTIVIETPRTYLREFDTVDAKDLFDLNNDPDVMRYTGDVPFTSIDAAREFISRYDHYQQYGYGRWALITKSNEWLGWCGLKFNPDANIVDLGFRLKKKYWGKGFAYEAGSHCLSFAFNHLQIPSIIGRAAEPNVRSIELLLKLGMKFKNSFVEGGLNWRVYETNTFATR